MTDNTLKTNLNEEQQEAVYYGFGPLLIIAGAGTGKTTVITERIKYLISQKKVKPSEILALTFTEKAAGEMEERIDKALPYGYTQMWIMTFHAFGDRVLRQEAIHMGLNPGYKLMTEAESVIFLRKNLFVLDLDYFRPLGNPNKFIEGILSHFSRLKDEDVSPKEYLLWAQGEREKGIRENEEEKIEIDKYLELANAYQKYEELKNKEGLMDFSDLISNTLKLFRLRKNVLQQYREQFKFILIDEYQDTNIAQNEMAVLLSGEKKNITVVADDDQSIYRFRGAAVSNIIQFRKNFPKTKIAVLTKNYRSTRNILDASYKLIQHNNPDRLEVKEKISKKLDSMRKTDGDAVTLIYHHRVEDEAEGLANKIKELKEKLHDKQGEELYRYKDFAILVRANNHAEPFTRALSRKGIPYQFLGPGQLFRQPEVKNLIAYLKVISDFNDSVAFFVFLSMPVFDLPLVDLVSLNNFARNTGLTLFEAVDVVVADYIKDNGHWSIKSNYQEIIPHLQTKTKSKLTSLFGMVKKHLEMSKTETAGQILYYFLEDSGLLTKLVDYKNLTEERQALNISKFFDKLKSYEVEHDDASVNTVVDWIDMSFELGESPLSADIDWVDNDAVNILTVHSSKGLEFPVVFLVNLVNQRFPTNERKEKIPIADKLIKEILPEGDYHLQEERRLFYVGMTRARDRLYLTAANYYGEGKRERKISPFVREVMGEENVERIKTTQNTIKQLSFSDWKKIDEVETKIKRKPLEYLSYSQLECYSVCPLQYKYRYILKIPLPTNAAESFGTSVHRTLERFYRMMKEAKKLSKEELLNLLKEEWIPVGYKNKTYEEKMKNRGIDMLSYYFDNFHKSDAIPLYLEQVFKIKLSASLTVGGKIDRIDNAGGGKIEIIDYKTGKRQTDKEIESSLQMTVYAMAATDPNVLNKKIEDVVLSFYFLQNGEKVSSARTGEQIEKAKKDLIIKAQDIGESNFKPKVGPWCGFCDFRLICEAWK